MTSTTALLACAGLMLAAAPVHAAAPHLNVLGIPLGARFVVPACTPSEVTVASRLCFNPAMVEREPWGAKYYVSVPAAGTPPYVRGEVTVHVVEGTAESVVMGTWGIEGQGAALDDLKRKYGPPASARQEQKHRGRSRFPSEFAEWDLGDVQVKLDGTAGSIDWGRIQYTTRRYRELAASREGGTPLRKQPPGHALQKAAPLAPGAR